MAPSQKPIIVIGAGVTGLSVATRLQSHHPTRQITIIAAETPTTTSPSVDYASMWAGAHYRPVPGSSEQLKQEAQLAHRTAETMQQIASESPEAGVAFLEAIEYLEEPPAEVLGLKTGDVYASRNDGFRVLDQSELPSGTKWGCEYRTYCVNVQLYCQWLLDRFRAKGGQLIVHKLSSAVEAFEFAQQRGLGKVQVVVNCSGRNFDQDPKMKFIRGQTVLVKQQYDKTVTRQNRDGTWAFLIPRPRGGGTIVGGTKEIGDTETRPRPETRRKLLQQSVQAYPDFIDSVDRFEVVKDNVGRRPWRDGGFRIETDLVSPDKSIVHGYGAGGRGYELSWGAAEKIVELVKESAAAKARL